MYYDEGNLQREIQKNNLHYYNPSVHIHIHTYKITGITLIAAHKLRYMRTFRQMITSSSVLVT